MRIPLRWYNKNTHGTMFGGTICAVVDPLNALMCGKIFPGVEVLTKRNVVDFVRPARTQVHLRIEITEEDIQVISKKLKDDGEAAHEFKYDVQDERNRIVAKVSNTVFIRNRLRKGRSMPLNGDERNGSK